MGRGSDHRSDLFSAGVMAFEALAGGRLFRGRDYAEVLASMLHADPHLHGAGPAVERLTAVLRKSLAPSPEMRYQTAAEMRRNLVAALASCPPLASGHEPDPGQADTRSMRA
jgi:serine/threonine-protein kinase